MVKKVLRQVLPFRHNTGALRQQRPHYAMRRAVNKMIKGTLNAKLLT